MDTPRNFQAGAFAGAAEAYLRYRPPYPAALLANLVAQAQLPASAVLLDLACGPGRVTLELAGGFEHVNAIDLEAEMIEVGRREAARRGVRNVDWRVGCQFASNRDPLFASNLDPSEAVGFGLSM